MDPRVVQEILHLQPPPKLSDHKKRINDRRNRNMRDKMIVDLLRCFAESTANPSENFGLCQFKVDDSFYFYGVVMDKPHYKYGRVINVESFPASYVKDTILAFLETYAPDAAGVYSGPDGLEYLYVDCKGIYRKKK